MKQKKYIRRSLIFFFLMICCSSTVFAASAEEAWANIWILLTTWIIRIGAAVALFGGVQIAISFASDNPDSRIRGLQFLAAGMIVMAVGAAPGIFGIG